MSYYRDWIDGIIGKFGPYSPGVLISERSNSIGNDTVSPREARSESNEKPITITESSIETTTTAKDRYL